MNILILFLYFSTIKIIYAFIYFYIFMYYFIYLDFFFINFNPCIYLLSYLLMCLSYLVLHMPSITQKDWQSEWLAATQSKVMNCASVT